MLLRLLIFIIYMTGAVYIFMNTIKKPPAPKKKFVDPLSRTLAAILGMWGVLLWPLPGLLWLGVLPSHMLSVLLLSICIPLVPFLIFIMWTKIVPVSIPAVFLVGVLVPLGLGGVLLMFYDFTVAQLLLYLLFMGLPPLCAIFALVLWGSLIIPVDPEEEGKLRKTLSLIVGFFTTFPKNTWMVVDGKAEPRIKGNPFLGSGPGWVMSEPHNAIVIKGSSDIRRIDGPGVIFTESGDLIHSVLDLRPQLRAQRVEAITRDGISVSLPISSIFQVNPGDGQIQLGQPWPYRKSDAFKVVFSAAEVNPQGKTPLKAHDAFPWLDLPLRVAIPQLKKVVAQYSLNHLYANPNTEKPVRADLGAAVREVVKETLEAKGFKVLGGGVGNKIYPTDQGVTEQRIEAWKASWTGKIMEWQAQTQAERFKAFAEAQSKARVDLVHKLLEKTSAQLQHADGKLTHNLIAYHLLDSLESIARSPEVRPLLPELALPALVNLRKKAKETKREPETKKEKEG
ncbi:MAG: hypothetical protein JW981_02010 [Anaerolineae bacterium]|nr:hypothetical protein [Anaerolineae bacterium]